MHGASAGGRIRMLADTALVVCTHELGKVDLRGGQALVRVERRPLLTRADPEGRPIRGCPNATSVTKPCTRTRRVKEGYSSLVRIEGRPVCLDTVRGPTDGQGGIYEYKVNDPGQDLVSER